VGSTGSQCHRLLVDVQDERGLRQERPARQVRAALTARPGHHRLRLVQQTVGARGLHPCTFEQQALQRLERIDAGPHEGQRIVHYLDATRAGATPSRPGVSADPQTGLTGRADSSRPVDATRPRVRTGREPGTYVEGVDGGPAVLREASSGVSSP